MTRTNQTARRSTGGRPPICVYPPNRNREPGLYTLVYEQLPKSDTTPFALPVTSFSSSAQTEVFNTPELLVIILSQLPHSSLLKTRSTCKTWASLYNHVQIRAGLFVQPRPSGSAAYAEMYSDLLVENFMKFWPVNEDKKEGWETVKFATQRPHSVPLMEGDEIPSTAKRSREKISRVRIRLQEYPNVWLHHLQWRNLLICQPSIQVLQVVQQIDVRGYGSMEFRALIPRPEGLRMGFLYDAVRYWHEVERSGVEIMWGRRSGKVGENRYHGVEQDSESNVGRMRGDIAWEDKPCITIFGSTSVGCGQYGGLTYEQYGGPGGNGNGNGTKGKERVFESGEEEVKFWMERWKSVDYDLGLDFAEEEEEEEE